MVSWLLFSWEGQLDAAVQEADRQLKRYCRLAVLATLTSAKQRRPRELKSSSIFPNSEFLPTNGVLALLVMQILARFSSFGRPLKTKRLAKPNTRVTTDYTSCLGESTVFLKYEIRVVVFKAIQLAYLIRLGHFQIIFMQASCRRKVNPTYCFILYIHFLPALFV